MNMTTEFKGVTESFAQKAFKATFEHYHHTYTNEGPAPTPEQDKHLRRLFEKAYPDHAAYLESLFDEPIRKADHFGIPAPEIPAPKILDPQVEVMPGMESFFLRLTYLQTLAKKASLDIDEKTDIAPDRVLPDLELLTAANLFHALRIETSKLMNQRVAAASTPSENPVASWLTKAYQGSTGGKLQTGFITDISSTSLVTGGVRKLVTVSLQKAGTAYTKLANISIDGDDKDHVKIGDLIGVSGLKKFNGRGNFMTADHSAILVPAQFISFLKTAEPDFTHLSKAERELIPLSDDPNEPDFKKGDVLSDDYYGTIIFGRVIDWDESRRTVTIKDKDNKTALIKTKEMVQNFKLEKNTVFLATPIQLGDDGIYTISTRTIQKLEAPYAGRLLSGLRSMSSKTNSLTSGEDFQVTEPMLT